MGTVIRRRPGTECPETLVSAWNQFEAHREFVLGQSLRAGYYGVSFPPEPDGSFDYLTGMAVRQVAVLPDGLEIREVPAATYAVFPSPLPAIGQTYGYIFGTWQLESGHVVQDTAPAFEEYPPATVVNAPVLLHIPLRDLDTAAHADGSGRRFP